MNLKPEEYFIKMYKTHNDHCKGDSELGEFFDIKLEVKFISFKFLYFFLERAKRLSNFQKIN